MLTIIIKIMTVIRKKLETTWRVKEGFTEEVILKLGLALPWWSSGCWFDSWFGKNPQVHAPQLRVVLARTPLQYSCLENPMDGGACWAAVHGVVKSQTRLSDFIFTFHFHELEKEIATHSSVLAWKIPGTAEPGGLPSMGSHRVGHY